MNKKSKGLLIASSVLLVCLIGFIVLTIIFSNNAFHAASGVIVPIFMIPLFVICLGVTIILAVVDIVLLVLFIINLKKYKKELNNAKSKQISD